MKVMMSFLKHMTVHTVYDYGFLIRAIYICIRLHCNIILSLNLERGSAFAVINTATVFFIRFVTIVACIYFGALMLSFG